MTRARTLFFAALSLLLFAGSPCMALDDAHWKKAKEAIDKGVAYLRTTQAEDGSWTAKPGPAVTAMALRVLLDQPDIRANDPAAKKALDYVLSKAKPDGGIYDTILENYNTAICLSALARVNDRPGVPEVIKNAQDYLRNLQWSGQTDPQGKAIDASHPFYGGAGYGREGRPDLSNTQAMIQGLYDSGLDCKDPAYQRALVFITRCQGTKANKEFGDKIKPDGGFVYSTSQSKDKIGIPETKAGEETLDVPGQGPKSVLRTYGSITYSGFKSYLYANLDRDDPRVVDAYKWICANYTLEQNPGMPEEQKLQGYYYYVLTFSRALSAWGSTTIPVAGKSGEKPEARDWANDLVDKLVSLQEKDGSWKNTADRWMEGDPNLTTVYALLALQKAIR